jgi:hypothetical protein
MKLRNVVMNAVNTPKITIKPDVVEKERSKSAPTPAEIRQRAFEIHIERGGIHGCDLDDWLQAERELQEKFKHEERGTTKKSDALLKFARGAQP